MFGLCIKLNQYFEIGGNILEKLYETVMCFLVMFKEILQSSFHDGESLKSSEDKPKRTI